jgi:prolipoprotein diacylglyceryltransferase
MLRAPMLIHPQIDPVAFSIGPLAVRWYGTRSNKGAMPPCRSPETVSRC